MADKTELVSWFLPERFMDSYYSRMILAIKRFEVDDDDDVEIACWEPALTRDRFAMPMRRTDEGRYGSYLLIKWLPQKELFAEVDNPGYTAQKRVVCSGEIAFQNIGSGLRDATNEVAVAGENCNLLLGNLAGVDPETQQRTAAGDPSLMCNDCALSVVKTQVEMPLASNADISSALSSIASSCKTTVAVTPPPAASPPWVKVGTAPIATSTATSACAGKT
ncbi:hypothetical protein COL154_008352 [Colletotrichum chrysophilum]|nr:hypothetical protein COL154_008352 [Colletotrichum chrysophilum]